MQAERRGGLSGKARKARYRHRAARLHSNHLIKEYFEPNESGSLVRYVPIRGRGEFLPSVAHIGTVFENNQQLELPLDRKGEERRASKDRSILFNPTADRAKTFDPRELEPAGDERQGMARDFTLRGFFMGCAMGSAAAALLLLVAHTTIR